MIDDGRHLVRRQQQLRRGFQSRSGVGVKVADGLVQDAPRYLNGNEGRCLEASREKARTYISNSEIAADEADKAAEATAGAAAEASAHRTERKTNGGW